MPVYVYRPVLDKNETRACDLCAGTFEMTQRMSDDAVAACPKCGQAVERVIQSVNLNNAGKYQKPSDSRMAAGGFTQYKRKGKGYYEKSFGNGPQTLTPGSDNA